MIKSFLTCSIIILSLFLYPLVTQNTLLYAKPYINEFMVSNILAHMNTHGDYEDWIEIYNSGDSPLDLAGYFITDDLQANTYWQFPSGQSTRTIIPAKGFRIFYADEKTYLGADHLGFKLDKDQEQIVLFAADGNTLLDSISYRNQFRDISYGRYPDGSSSWVYNSTITPGSANTSGYSFFALPPSVDKDAGFYNGGLNITAQPYQGGDIIHYTLDGSDPLENSALYVTPVQINQTSIFKVRVFNPGTVPSPITTRAFFIDVAHSLPVLALMTDPKNLYDPVTGIYTHDNDGRAWERYSELEYFKEQSLSFHLPCGLRIQGNTGPTDYDKKSFRAYFREGFGMEELDYRLFVHDSVKYFNRLVLRSGYDDSMEPNTDGKNIRATLLRDPLVTELWRRTGNLTPQSSFAVLYLNKNFHGIYDLKQSIDEDFVKDHLGYSDIDLMRTRWDSTELVYGERTKWLELISFFQNNTFSSDLKIAEAAQLMDLDNYLDLQVLMHAAEYRGWAYGVFMFRNKIPSARWQWTIWDADRSFNTVTWNGLTNQYNPLGIDLDNLITKKLLQNLEFKYRYINRIADLLNTVFSSVNMNSVIDSLAQEIAPEIPAEVSKWNNTISKWNENVEFLKNFADQRPSIIRQQLQDYFQLSGQAEINISISSGNGKIKVNSLTITQFPWTGTYFQNVPIMVTALPDPGYHFSGWSDPSVPARESITLNLTGDQLLSPIFAQLAYANAELITPSRVPTGQHLPVVVRIRDASWEINPVEQTPLQMNFDGIRSDTLIQIKRGAGTAAIQVNSDSAFTLSVHNSSVALMQKQIEISSVPVINYSGTLPAGDIIWDKSADRLVASNLTIPAGCRLIVKPGTWIIVKKYVNFYVQGQLAVEGTAKEPVVITSEKWSEPWGGMEFQNGLASFQYCMVLNGGGDLTKGNPTNDGWHTGHQHIFFGKDNSEFVFDNCFFLYSPGKVFGVQDGKVTVTNCITSFVWHGGEFHRVLLFYQNSHLMNLPNDDHIYTEDIDTDGFHIDFVNPQYPQYSIIDRCYFITGKDDAIDHHYSRLRISNCWLEDFIHEGVAASGGDTVKIFNTVAINNDQGFEAGWTESGVNKGPYVYIDHCVAVGNNVGLRIGDSYAWTYKDFMKVTNSIVYNNQDNIRNYLNSTQAPLPGALEISYSMTNDPDYDNSPYCITGVPQFDPYYYLLAGSPGANLGQRGTNMGRADSSAIDIGSVVINEIMYNAPPEMDTGDWIELYNSQPADQYLSGWILRDNDNMHTFEVPSGTIIPAKSYYILCTDTLAFLDFHPDVKNLAGNILFGFGGNDQVRLFTPFGRLADSVAYQNNGLWPDRADGAGYSLELLDARLNHTLPENWASSVQVGGSPGRANRTMSTGSKPVENLPTHLILEQNYPNPFNPITRIVYSIPQAGKVRLILYNLLGQKVREMIYTSFQSAGRYQVDLDARALPSGIYIYQILFTSVEGSKQKLTRKMVLIR